MKIALIGHKPAYPKVDGGCVASAAFLDNLIDAGCDVYYGMISTPKHPFQKDSFPTTIQEKVHLEAIEVDTSTRPTQALKYLFSNKSYNVERFYDRNFEALLAARIKDEAFDAVIFDNVFAARYLEAFKKQGIPCYIRTHNAEFEIWETLASSANNPLKKWYLKRLAKTLKDFETTTLELADGILSITRDDLDVFQSLNIKTNACVIPVSIETPEYSHNYTNKNLFHFGAMNWQPNIDTVNKTIELLPKIQSKLPEISFVIAGKDSDSWATNFDQQNIQVTGFIPSIPVFLKDQGILISPTQSGSGVRIKILEMMSYGIPVISTKLGARGVEDLSGIRIAESDSEIEEAVYELYNDENVRRELGIKAKSIISLHYNPKSISKKILEFLKQS